MSQADVRAGAAYAQEDARRMLEDALLLYGKGRFRGAIPPAILSVEESLKGVSLGFALDEQRAVTSEDWDDLKKHQCKLGHVPELIVKGMEGGRVPGSSMHQGTESGAGHKAGQPIVRVCALKNARRTRELVRNLQAIKEMCKYEEWDGNITAREGWSLDGGDLEALALFVLELARAHCEIPRAGVGAALGTLVSRGATLEMCKRIMPGAAEACMGKVQKGEAVLRRLNAAIDAREGALEASHGPGNGP